jgi:hypothetical protein
MTYPSGTADLSDDEFVRQLTSHMLPNERFHHYDHIRLAWIFLREQEIGAATERMVRTLQAFGLHIRGNLSRYHDTVTRGFMRLVAAHIRMTPDIERFDEFAAKHPMLFDKNALHAFYSPELLDSPPARTGWIEPDLRPLP